MYKSLLILLQHRGSEHRERDHFPDGLGTREQHTQTVDSAAPASCWRHTVLKGFHKVCIAPAQLVIVASEGGLNTEGFLLV